MNRHPTCRCESGYQDGHCMNCGAADAPDRYELRPWVRVVAVIIVSSVIGWVLAGQALKRWPMPKAVVHGELEQRLLQ